MQRMISIGVFSVLVSCSGETNYETKIVNNSDREIKILLYDNGFARGDTLRITSGSTRLVSRSTANQAEEEEPDCAERIDSAYVQVEGGGNLVKDIASSDNWDVSSEQTKTVPREFEHECTFTISDSDIEE